MVLLREARTISDTNLVQECQAGDSSAFDEIVRRYKNRIYTVIYRFLGDREDSLDVTQEAFIRAYHAIQKYQGTAHVYTWLYSIATNLARNRLRDGSRKGRNKAVSLDTMVSSRVQGSTRTDTTPRTMAESRELDDLLQQCLNDLPENCRIAFVLRTFDDLSYDEIADVLGCPSGTVKSRIHQARMLLRDRLRDMTMI